MPAYTVNAAMLTSLTAELVIAYVASNKIPAIEIPDLVENIYCALQRIAEDSKEKSSFFLHALDSAGPEERRARRHSLSLSPTEATNNIAGSTKFTRRNRQRKAPGRRRRC